MDHQPKKSSSSGKAKSLRGWARVRGWIVGSASETLPAASPQQEPKPSSGEIPGPLAFRVFGIGLSRTGTTSLTEALKLLGIRTTHFPRSHKDLIAHGGATDTPVAVGFAYLDIMYPGSKFILTVRSDVEAWLDSCEWLWRTYLQDQNEFYQKIHRALYDSVGFDREKFRTAYFHHLVEVQRYFAGRHGDLLILDATWGEGWTKLCPFLGLPEPPLPYPHTNQKLPTSQQPLTGS